MNKEDESPDDFFDIAEDEPYVKTLFILDNIQNSDTSEKKLQFQIDVSSNVKGCSAVNSSTHP